MYNTKRFLTMSDDSESEMARYVVTENLKKRRKAIKTKKKLRISRHCTGKDCQCSRFHCFEEVPVEGRRWIIRSFNELTSRDEQSSHLASLITVNPIKRRRSRMDPSISILFKRAMSYSYKVRFMINNEVVEKPVCYKAFQALHGVSSKSVQKIKKALCEQGKSKPDMRGKHGNHVHRLSEETRQAVMKHIVGSKDVEDFSNVRRLCATITESVDPIFDGEGLQNDLEDKIYKHLAIQETKYAANESILEDSPNEPKIKSEPLNSDLIKSVLLNYLQMLELDENSSFRTVCQKCEVECDSIESIVGHMETEHVDDVISEGAVNAFIEENITFEEVLLSDIEQSDRDSNDDNDDDQSQQDQQPQTHLQKKFNKNESGNPHACPTCGKVLSNRFSLARHLQLHSNIVHTCATCAREYRSVSALKRHEKIAHGGVLSYTCSHCGESFATQRECNSHQSAKHQIHTKIHECTECSQTFYNKSSLDCHYDMHFDRRRYACYICKKKFRKSSHLNCHLTTHMKLKENPTDVEAYDDLSRAGMRGAKAVTGAGGTRVIEDGRVRWECDECGKRLSTRKTLRIHRRIHRGERPYVCHICGGQFRAVHGLRRHLVETHMRRRHRACPLCPARFGNPRNLKEHMRRHTGEKPYVCALCGKRFAQSGSLRMHALTHTDVFPFECTECGAKFRQRGHLTRHSARHAGDRPRPHACSTCSLAFPTRRDLRTHGAACIAANSSKNDARE